MGSAVALLKELRNSNLPLVNSLSAYCQLSTKQTNKACKIAKTNVFTYPADILGRYQLNMIAFRECQ